MDVLVLTRRGVLVAAVASRDARCHVSPHPRDPSFSLQSPSPLQEHFEVDDDVHDDESTSSSNLAAPSTTGEVHHRRRRSQRRAISGTRPWCNPSQILIYIYAEKKRRVFERERLRQRRGIEAKGAVKLLNYYRKCGLVISFRKNPLLIFIVTASVYNFAVIRAPV